MHVFDIYNNEIAYYKTPKCGSRTVLGWAALIKNPKLISEHPDWFAESRQQKEYNEFNKYIKVYKKITHDQKIRFCILRDPIERFVSAFTNRILFHKKPPSDITISEFIENMDNILKQKEYDKHVKIHFSAQTEHIGKNPAIYTHIFNMHKMQDLKTLLEEYTNTKLPDLYLQQSGNVIKPTLTTEERNIISARYEEDYKIYGKYIEK